MAMIKTPVKGMPEQQKFSAAALPEIKLVEKIHLKPFWRCWLMKKIELVDEVQIEQQSQLIYDEWFMITNFFR